jgi:hypothetical protein
MGQPDSRLTAQTQPLSQQLSVVSTAGGTATWADLDRHD